MNSYEDEMKRELDETVKEDAQQMRESQRQKFIKDLVNASYKRKVELNDEAFYMGLASIIAKYLRSRQGGVVKPEIGLGNLGTFFASVLVTIRNFARTKEEEDVLVAQFLEKVLADGLSPFHEALTEQEM